MLKQKMNERKEIFQVHLKPIKLEPGIDIDFLAKQTPGNLRRYPEPTL